MLDRIASNGRPYLAIGFETLSKKNAPMLGNKMKASLMNRYGEGVSVLKEKGIDVGGSFMFGFPGDTHDDLQRITDFIKIHGIRGYITRYSVIPGSRLYDDVLAEYESEVGPLIEEGSRKARILNEFFMSRNGFDFWETEDMIVDALKGDYGSELPLPQIDALAVYRSFFVQRGET